MEGFFYLAVWGERIVKVSKKRGMNILNFGKNSFSLMKSIIIYVRSSCSIKYKSAEYGRRN